MKIGIPNGLPFPRQYLSGQRPYGILEQAYLSTEHQIIGAKINIEDHSEKNDAMR